MADLVPADEIEVIVGIARHETLHYGRADTEIEVFFILHSKACKDSGVDLRECHYSQCLDRGVDQEAWVDHEDEPVVLSIEHGKLVPDARELQ